MLKMGAFIAGPLTINTISGNAVVNFGGTLFVTPKNVSKNSLGSGGGHTSVITISFVGPSVTNTFDANVIDQPLVLDN
jgi:spore germination protein PF